MNTGPTTDFDSFDRALLTELRQVAAEGAPAPARRTRRWTYAGSGVAVAAVTAFGLGTIGSPSAYAVDETGDGDIVITIHELDDADGLEQALADHGIEAEVDYQADGEQSFGGATGLGLADPSDPPDGGQLDGNVEEGHAEAHVEAHGEGRLDVGGEEPWADDPCGGIDDMPFDAELRSDDYVITIPTDSVLRESDAVLQITTSGDVADRVAGILVAFSIGDVDCGFGTASASANAED